MTSTDTSDIITSIANCSRDCRRTMYENIILSGGNTLFPGFAKRLQIELERRSGNVTPSILAVPERRYSITLLVTSFLHVKVSSYFCICVLSHMSALNLNND
jgi:actin-related protein